MITIGVDFHKNSSTYSILNEQGHRMKTCKLENRPELIQQFLSQIPGPKQLAMEATRNWGLYYDTVNPYIDSFLLGHPKKMKAITESETKYDQKDAEMISRLAHSRFFPKAYVAPTSIRQLRSLLRYRYFLVGQRKSIRNQTQILLDRNLWPCQRPKSFKNIFCKRGLLWLKNLDLPYRERFILNDLILSFLELSEHINSLESFIKTQAMELQDLKYIRRIPGFRASKVNAYIVLLELADIQRFRKARHFAHYAGLIPRENSSGQKHRTGRLVKQANHFLRLALIESTFGALRVDRNLKAYYQSVKKRAGSGAAIIACARKLSYAVYHVLKNKTDYCPYPPATAYSPLSVSSSRR